MFLLRAVLNILVRNASPRGQSVIKIQSYNLLYFTNEMNGVLSKSLLIQSIGLPKVVCIIYRSY